MSQQAKLTLRAPPHRQFIQGWPGIPAGAGRPAAQIAGSVEVRLGGKGFKASWLRIELRKIESTPSGENWAELIGRGPIEVWTADGTAEHDEEGDWDLLQTADFPFTISIPEGLPPTARLEKQSGISYEVVSSLCVKTKKGLLRKENTSTVIQSTHPIVLEKHELHSTWPIYSVPDDHEAVANQIVARVYRKQTCYAPGDNVEVRVILTSKNVNPVKIKSVAFSVRETITFRGGKRASRMLGGATKSANQRTETIASKTQSIGSKINKGDVKTYDLSLLIPKTHALMTVQTAKHIEVAYTLRVYVDSKQPVILDHLPLTMTTVPRSTSATVVPKIGFVPGLSAPLDSQESLRYGEQIQRPQSAGAASTVVRAPSGRRTPTLQGPTRSFSYQSTAPSDTSTERRYGSNLNRRDTVMTNTTTASGPGLAGRGVPGQIFSWGQYGAAQPYSPFGSGRGPVRPAFAGPGSIYEGRELAPEENRALFHHSLANPLGQVFEGQDPLPSVNLDSQIRSSSMPTSRQGGSAMSSQRNSFSQREETRAPLTPDRAEKAELEKERLYHRAREQAERNQRRAAEAAAAGASALKAEPSIRAVSSPHTPVTASSNEKQALYERARREAERYQASFAQGTPFPSEDMAAEDAPRDQRASTSVAHGNATALAAATTALGPNVLRNARNTNSSPRPARTESSTSIFTAQQAYPSAEDEKRRLYEAAKAERDAHIGSASRHGHSSSRPTSTHPDPQRSVQVASPVPTLDDEARRFETARAERDAYLRAQGSMSPHTSSPASSTTALPYARAGKAVASRMASTSSFPSAEEEKRRLYAQAKAEVEASQGASRSSAGPAVPTSASSQSVGRNAGSEPPARAFPSAEEEKRMLYERAKAEVETNQPGSSTRPVSMAQAAPTSSVEQPPVQAAVPAPVPPPTSHQAQVAQPAATLSAEDEKLQMKRFYEAQDAVSRHQGQYSSPGASASSAPAVSAPAVIARPEPAYALGYRSSSGAGPPPPPPMQLPTPGQIPTPVQPAALSHSQGVPSRHAVASPHAAPSPQFPGSLPLSSPPVPTAAAYSATPASPALHDPQPNGGSQGLLAQYHPNGAWSSPASAPPPVAVIPPAGPSSPLQSTTTPVGKRRTLPSPIASPPPTLPMFHFSSLSGTLPPTANGQSAYEQMGPGSFNPSSGFAHGPNGANGGYNSSLHVYRPTPPPPAPPRILAQLDDASPSQPRATSMYAPRMAPSNWHEAEDDDGGFSGGHGSSRSHDFTSMTTGAGRAVPPPIPPKTPLGGSSFRSP